jgi:4-amino-4-deoxy-L-arabinose transferase-like glycosyltransferase
MRNVAPLGLPFDPDRHARIATGVLLAVATTALFFRLGQQTLLDWDEAIYARVSHEIVSTGDWLTLHWEGRPYLRKPPLFMWTTAVLYSVFGVSEFWARAASAASGIGVLYLTVAIGRTVYGATAGLLAGAVLLTSYQFIASARFGTTDMMLCLYFMFVLYAYLHVQRGDPRWWVPLWLGCALAFMTKSAAGLLGPLAVVIALLLDRGAGTALRTRTFWIGAAIALVVVLPWHLLMLRLHGEAFVDQYLGHSITERATGVIDGHAGGRLYYVDRLYAYFHPWVLLVPFALLLSVRQVLSGNARARVLLVAAVLVFGLFTLAATKLRWYILPLYPLLALFIGWLLWDALRSWRSIAFAALPIGLAGLLLTTPAMVTAMLLALTAVSLPFILWRRQAAPVLIFLAFVAVAAGGLRSLYSGGESPIARLASTAGADLRGSEHRLIVYRGLHRPAALFYAGHPIEVVHTRSALEASVAPGESRGIILHRDDVPDLADGFLLRVLAAEWELVYATIMRLHARGDDEG